MNMPLEKVLSSVDAIFKKWGIPTDQILNTLGAFIAFMAFLGFVVHEYKTHTTLDPYGPGARTITRQTAPFSYLAGRFRTLLGAILMFGIFVSMLYRLISGQQ